MKDRESTIYETEFQVPTISRPQKDPHQKKSRGAALIAALLVALLTLLGIGLVPRMMRSSEARNVSRGVSEHVSTVLTVRAHPSAPVSEITLPGNIQAVYVSSLYARSTGFVKRRLVDIGQKVRAGQLLAEIEAPEVDQQLAQSKGALAQTQAAFALANANLSEAEASVTQARAVLEQAKANQEIAKTTDLRWTRLVDRGVIPRQQGDEKRSSYQARVAEVAAAEANIQTAQATVSARRAGIEAARANIAAAQSDVRRLQDMVSFERVVAPFDGVITERKIERGDLIGSGTAGQTHLFSIAQADVLRIQTQVPQFYAAEIKDGQTAQIDVRDLGGKPITGKVARSASALNSQSRTLLVEVEIDNRNGQLLPGMYADVKFSLPQKKNNVVVPADTLVVNADGTRVVTVGAEGKVHYQKVEVGRDLGGEIEILSGLNGGEQLVSNPVDSLAEGQPVQVRTAASNPGKV